jgi:hypothetical protein
MKQHVEFGIIVAMSALMVFAMTSYMMPFVHAAVSSGGGSSGTSGSSGASASGSTGGAGGAGSNPAKTTTGGSSGGTTGGSSGGTTGGSSGGTTGGTTHPPPKNPPPTYKPCVPGKCLGTPGYYTTNGHHHCYDGAPGCACTDPHKCTVGKASTRPGA